MKFLKLDPTISILALQDWWNSPSYADWYRSWNVVVHDWLYTYVYKDLLRVRSIESGFFCSV